MEKSDGKTDWATMRKSRVCSAQRKREGKEPGKRSFIVVIRLSMAVEGIFISRSFPPFALFYFPATYLRFRFQLGGWQVIKNLIQNLCLGPVAGPTPSHF